MKTTTRGLLVLMFLLTAAQASLCAPSDNAPAKVTPKEPGKFRLLIITDLHFSVGGAVVDKQTMMDVKKMIRKFSPELLVITGDMWSNNPNGEGQKVLERAAKEMGKLGIPWAFAWGNHDLLDDYDKGHAVLRNAENSLYRGDASDGDYRIEIQDVKGGAAWNLIVLNDSRGGMSQAPLDWFEAETARIKKDNPSPPPAFLMFHIPIRQYEESAKAAGASGVKLETVCHEGEKTNALEVFKKSGMVKAIFVGHDHINNYDGDVDGVRLAYVRATGYSGYGYDRVRKGGSLVDIDLNAKTYAITTALPNGTTWSATEMNTSEPSPGKPY